MEKDLNVIGPVQVVLYVRSSLEHTDFVARLCDVSPKGKSINLCDGIYRITAGKDIQQPDGTFKIEIDLWSTANCFKKGHAIRVHVASAGVPRWAVNSGNGVSSAPGKSGEAKHIFSTTMHILR
ncbi:MAG: CocE/NonD family hydrolase [Anaerolineae bacterium]|nr:CocE/NonD family hydrolase [Anaerolineae bacterium]